MELITLSQEQLLLLLWSVAQSSADGVQPSAYVQFNYKKSSDRLDIREMLIMPAITAWGLEPCSLSMWLSVTKYPLQATFHLISVNMGPCFLQLFASALTGDVLIRLVSYVQVWGLGVLLEIYISISLVVSITTLNRMTSGLQLDTPDTNNIITLGSVFAPNRWHHLLVTVFPPNGSSQSYKVLLLPSPYQDLTTSPYHHLTTPTLSPSPHHLTTPHLITISSHHLTTSPYHHLTTPPTSPTYHHLTTSPSHHFTISPLHLITISPLHLITISPLHLITLSPSHLTHSPNSCWLLLMVQMCSDTLLCHLYTLKPRLLTISSIL